MSGTFQSERLFHTMSPEHVPKPIAWGNFQSNPDIWFYICAFHNMEDEVVPEARNFVSVISKIHEDSMRHSSEYCSRFQTYGFPVTTHLANIPNDNTWQPTWEAWFLQAMKRIFEVEERSHGKDDELEVLKEALYEKVIPRLLRPLETGGRSIQPCLVHSDLWPGNVQRDVDTGKIMIFDSCAFWGHNEADLGSWRAPRYKMGKPFLEEYKKVMEMSEPKADWDDRNALYALYVIQQRCL